MAQYINTRVQKTPDGSNWLVEGQNGSTYNWDTLLRYSVARERSDVRARTAACSLAQDFSKKSRQPVTAYDTGGRAMATYMKGEPYYGKEAKHGI